MKTIQVIDLLWYHLILLYLIFLCSTCTEIRFVELPWPGSLGWTKTTEYPSESWKEETEYPSTEGPTNSWWDIDR